eukprot:6174076-Amphidinium_carterae.1
MTKIYGDIRCGQPACGFGNCTLVEESVSLCELIKHTHTRVLCMTNANVLLQIKSQDGNLNS